MVTMRRVWWRALLVAMVGAGAVGGGAEAGAQPATARPAQAEAPLALSVSPSTGLTGGQVVQVTVTGSGPEVEQTLYLAQCDAAVGDDPTIGELFANCGNEAVVLPGTRPTQQGHRVAATFTSFTGRVIACGDTPDDCVLTVSGEGGRPFAAAPIGILPGPLQLHARPTANLVAGTAIDVQVTGTRSAVVGVAQCGPGVVAVRDVFDGPCGPPALVPAGTATAEVVLVADDVVEGADGTVVTCGDDCVIAASSRDTTDFAVTPIEFAGTDPEVHANPATGLTDGQAVLVVATDVLPSVDGPPFWIFPSTGRWAVLQCGRAVAGDPTIAGVLTHCAAPPGGGPVPGSGSDLVVDVRVQATVTSPVGTTTGCTAPPDACVVALARVEPDGSVSLLTGPLTFARRP